MMKVKLVEGAYFRVDDRVDVFYIVPILIVVGLFSMSLINYFLMIFCFVAGFFIKYSRGIK